MGRFDEAVTELIRTVLASIFSGLVLAFLGLRLKSWWHRRENHETREQADRSRLDKIELAVTGLPQQFQNIHEGVERLEDKLDAIGTRTSEEHRRLDVRIAWLEAQSEYRRRQRERGEEGK